MSALNEITIARIIWDAKNIEHIARHNVITVEVEQVLHSNFSARSTYRARLMIIGKTESGRILTIIVHEDDAEIFYVVTARDSSPEECQIYQTERGELNEKT